MEITKKRSVPKSQEKGRYFETFSPRPGLPSDHDPKAVNKSPTGQKEKNLKGKDNADYEPIETRFRNQRLHKKSKRSGSNKIFHRAKAESHRHD